MYDITNLGPNSNVIDVPRNWTEVELLDTVQTLMEAAGYTLSASTVAGSSTGDNDYYNMLHHGDTDANYLKGIRLQCVRYSSTYDLRISGFEKGTYSTATMVNETPQNTCRLTGNGCRLYCFIGDGYCIFYSRHFDGLNEDWIGVTEFTDVLGLPFGPNSDDPSSRLVCFSETTMCSGTSNQMEPVSYLSNGRSKLTTSSYSLCLSSIGCWGTGIGSTSTSALNSASVSVLDQPVSGYVRNLASSITVMMQCNSVPYILGTLYGIKIVNKGAGNPLDTITIKTDANGFCNETGADTDHFILTGRGISNTLLNNSVCFAVPK